MAVFGAGAMFEGEEWVRLRYHMSTLMLLAYILVTCLSLGLLAGLLNPYVTSRLKAAIAGAISCLPTGIFVTAALGSQFGLLASIGIALFIAALIGGLGGAVIYRP